MKRKPRVIRVWAVLACLAFAVVVAVGSVPLLAWRGQPHSLQQALRGFTWYEMRGSTGSAMYFGNTRRIGLESWDVGTQGSKHPALPAPIPTTSDPRPAWALPRDGSSSPHHVAWSVGVPFRSAVGWASGITTFDPVLGPLWISQPPSRIAKFDAGRMYFKIPVVPHWPGLLANTLIFFMIPFLPWTLLRWRRLRRIERLGLCYQCRYEFPREISICPECGTTRPPN